MHRPAPSDPQFQFHGRHAASRRPPWRQRLVQAERGLVGGVRGDSIFFVHFFGGSIAVATAFVLGIGPVQWALVLLCLTLVFTAEMFNQALKALLHREDGAPPPFVVQRVTALGTAAVMAATAGSAIALALIFWQRLGMLISP